MRPGLLLLMGLAGCTLVDQNTFNPTASARPPVQAAPATAAPVPAGPRPLLTVLPPAEFREAVRQAVTAARARKADVVFDVVAVVPSGSEAPGTDAAAVGRAIVAQGVPPARVRLLARPEPGAAGREVRVFVR